MAVKILKLIFGFIRAFALLVAGLAILHAIALAGIALMIAGTFDLVLQLIKVIEGN